MLSRQRQWQLKMERLGLCTICGKAPLYRAGRCEPCNKKHLDFRRRRRQERNENQAAVLARRKA